MLLTELEDFVTRHRLCGTMTGDATEPETNGYMVTISLLLRRRVHAVGDVGGCRARATVGRGLTLTLSPAARALARAYRPAREIPGSRLQIQLKAVSGALASP
jgi:hypothetical protein